MKFEEALTALRNGKKIRHPSFENDVYLMGCYVTVKFAYETFEEAKERGMSIVKMKGEREHIDMCPPLNFDKFPEPPSINIFILMADDWEIVE